MNSRPIDLFLWLILQQGSKVASMYTLSSSSPLLLSRIHSTHVSFSSLRSHFLANWASDLHFPNQVVFFVLILFDLSTTFAVVACSLLLEISSSLGFCNITLWVFLLPPWLLLLSPLHWMFFSLQLLNVWGLLDSGLRQFPYLHPFPRGSLPVSWS